MSEERAIADLRAQGYGDRVIHLEVSTATVDLAAQALGVGPEKIAKSLTFKDPQGAPILIVMAGDRRLDNRKFKDHFHFKAKMLSLDEVGEKIGHEVGGVCPFGIQEGVRVYCDQSLRAYDWVYPACGSDLVVAKFRPEELYSLSRAQAWVDLTK
ncbi:MAG: YbaK/EbsC family protein [Tissierellia bacterium]|nr:YbaK/EbsC family protein [Tissierellia bacterium]